MTVEQYLRIKNRIGPLTAEEAAACEEFEKKVDEVWVSPGFQRFRKHTAETYRRRQAAAPSTRRTRPAPAPRRREHRSKAKRTRAVANRSRSSSRGESDREPPLERSCEGCGEPFTPSRPNQRHHDAKCRTAAYRSRRSLLPRYREEVFAARKKGELNEFEAIELLALPSERVLTLLASPRAKLEYRAQPDPAKRLAGELAWARDVVDAVICETWRVAA